MSITNKTKGAGIGVVLLLCVAAGIVILRQSSHKPISTTPSSSAQKVITAADKLAQNGQTEAAKTALKNFLATNPSQADRYQAEIQLFGVTTEQKDYVTANTYSQAALKDAPTVSDADYVRAGDAADRANDSTAAVEAYKQAILLMQKDPNPNTGGMITYLNDKIARLKQ